MLEETRAETFIAMCDDCGAAAEPISGSRELAVTRLMLRRWHIRTRGAATTTICPSCRSITPLPPRSAG